MPRLLTLALVCAVLLGTPAVAGDPAGGYFANKRWGYKVRVPKGWNQAAMSADEEWIASKHLGKRELEPKRSEYWTREAPEMWVIGFPHIRKGQRTAKRVDQVDGIELIVNNPYADYKDFVKRNNRFLTRSWEGSGYYFSKEEETEINGVKVTQYEIKMEKLVNAPRRVVAWVYHFDDIDFAIQFKILEDHYKGYKGGFKTCLKSFKRAERTKALPGSATTGKKIVESEDIEKLSAEERKKTLKDRVKQKYQREIDALPKGWKDKGSAHYLVLYNCDEKFMRKTLAHAEAVRDHLDKLFGGVGDKFVPKAIIRIFTSDAERDAYRSSTRSVWDEVQELLVVQGHGWEKDWEYGYLNTNVFNAWLYYRNRNLSMNMPGWLSSGLYKYMDMLRTKGKRIDFTNEDWGRDDMRLQIKRGEYVSLKELMSTETWSPDGGEAAAMQGWQKSRQAASVVYWLMTKGNRGKYKRLVADYLIHLTNVVEGVQADFEEKMEKLEAKAKDAAEAAAASGDDDSEEEEENEEEFDPAKFREELFEAFKKKRKEILEETFKRTFGSWKDKDWDRFTRAWLNHAD
ncbi:MAG: hypothetical protein ACYTEZ_18010 [Planctomycetota bacterium]|jgi:hypothetical protein